jgi:hypothetical protein
MSLKLVDLGDFESMVKYNLLQRRAYSISSDDPKHIQVS